MCLQKNIHRRQTGSVLLVALVLLLLLTFASTTSMRTSILELKMAGNEESRIGTLELSQSITDEVVGNPNNMVVNGTDGYTNCTSNVNGCNISTVAINANLVPNTNLSKATVIVTRLSPLSTPAPRGINSSADKFYAARFEVDTTYDGTADNQGKAGIVQGVLILIPKNSQTN